MSRYGRNTCDDITNFYLEASRGNIDHVSSLHIFGYAEDVDPADGQVDIWDGVSSTIGGKVNPFNWIDSGPIALQASSTDLSDTTTVQVVGLDEDWRMQTASVSLTGQTPAILSGLWNRVLSASNEGSTGLAGHVFISDSGQASTLGRPDDTTKIRGVIHSENERTTMALYTVPAGHTLQITHGWGNISKAIASEAVIRIFKRKPGGIFQLVHTFSLQTTGSSRDARPYVIPIAWKEREDIIYRATAFSNNTSISAGLHGVLIKN